jgi:biotin-[acetyl-CoA-carboxylase] ligase BirA-like protein
MNLNHIHFEELVSTNDYAKQNFRNLSHFTFISTDFQSKGRGQFDHVWVSEKNENILLSLLIKDSNQMNANTLQDKVLDILINFFKNYDVEVRFKPPNDLYVKDKKICGLLIETSFIGEQCQYVVVGMGININQIEFKNLEATSLKIINQIDYDVKLVRQKLMHQLNSLNEM